ncbi:FtsP/CotA-like multicopper oxidase with cupredoxin domain [Luteibacter sp. Sphag1AF]|uniref:copper resistance system multicopper oxidase n=1 Tax=Luteibacter sp. Sphag1AF TaxID=2587031 RepID=UPI00161C9C09|nr:copper resistance system multicopper oxidase [Luteibacter sp. Sphag1AF]MBB3226750.1 FtsP/CotA-like multicopper oxidase with cupredoxin domain [Luteibacter sp. Sphag1AF]
MSSHPSDLDISRRRFVRGLAVGGLVLGAGLGRAGNSIAQVRPIAGETPGSIEYAIDIVEAPVNYTGKARRAVTVNGGVPGPLLRWKEGTPVTIRVTNRLKTPTSLHWHGILLPADQDGVPGLSFDGIAPGETFTYRFPVRQSGTYWYHSHTRFQEQVGLYGPIIIDPAGEEPHPVQRDYVLLLSDWTDEDPERVYSKLKTRSDVYNYGQPTVGDVVRDIRADGVRGAMAKRGMWNRMRMSPTDLSDVSGATYTYLMNGTTPRGNWTGAFTPGEKIRLRVINGSSSTIFDLRVPGLKMTVIATDGQNVEPVDVDEMRVAPAETYDVLVEPAEHRAYTIFAQSIDRSGFARGTLSPGHGMTAAVPAVDAREWLSMDDMMGAMDGDGPMAHHARTEYGVGVDMRVDMPRVNLDDPGIGLRDNGRRVLTYADLRTVGGPRDARAPTRDIELHLTGNMERFMWSFDGQKFSEAKPIHLHLGERVRFILVNDTMMNHPIHLHGMWSEMESPEGAFQVRKHTINVQPAQRITWLVSADTPGRWAFHCHMLYHMEAGMFREVVVS